MLGRFGALACAVPLLGGCILITGEQNAGGGGSGQGGEGVTAAATTATGKSTTMSSSTGAGGGASCGLPTGFDALTGLEGRRVHSVAADETESYFVMEDLAAMPGSADVLSWNVDASGAVPWAQLQTPSALGPGSLHVAPSRTLLLIANEEATRIRASVAQSPDDTTALPHYGGTPQLVDGTLWLVAGNPQQVMTAVPDWNGMQFLVAPTPVAAIQQVPSPPASAVGPLGYAVARSEAFSVCNGIGCTVSPPFPAHGLAVGASHVYAVSPQGRQSFDPSMTPFPASPLVPSPAYLAVATSGEFVAFARADSAGPVLEVCCDTPVGALDCPELPIPNPFTADLQVLAAGPSGTFVVVLSSGMGAHVLRTKP